MMLLRAYWALGLALTASLSLRWQVQIGLYTSRFLTRSPPPWRSMILFLATRRAKVLEYFGELPPCLVGIEACPSAHHWGRELQTLGHTVKLIPPSYVKAYLKRSKNDANDAAAICEAVTRPSMRFVPIKTKEQQTALMLHRTR